MALNFHDKPKSQNPTYCLFFLSELTVSKINASLNILQSLLALYQLLLHKKSIFIIYCCGLPNILLKI